MTFYLPKELLTEGLTASDKHELGNEEYFTTKGLIPIKKKLPEAQSNRLKEMQRFLQLKILLKLFERYLESNPKEYSNRTLLAALRSRQYEGMVEYEPTNIELKRFIASLKYQLAQLSAHGYPMYSAFRLLGLKFKQFELLYEIAARLKTLSTKATQLRTQGLKDLEVDSERLSIFNLLTTNLELRAALLAQGNTSASGLANTTSAHLEEAIDDARERLYNTRAIIKNGGWGYIYKIKYKVQVLKRLST